MPKPSDRPDKANKNDKNDKAEKPDKRARSEAKGGDKAGRESPKPSEATGRPVARPAGPPPKVKRPVVAFPRKNQPPAADAFAARLPLPLGRRFDMMRTYLLRQKGVTEEVYFYGSAAGFALRYLIEGRPLCSLHVYDEKPLGIVSLDPPALAAIDWSGLSPVAQHARKVAHGSHNRAWLDIPLEGTGVTDFKTMLKTKVAVMVRGTAGEAQGATATDDDSA